MNPVPYPDPTASRLRRSTLGPDGLDEPLIRRVVDRFYASARRDLVIGPIFTRVIPDAAWQAHLATIADFWSSMLLGSGRYGGRPMPKHLAIAELDDAHFRRWLSLFRSIVEAECPPDIAALFNDRAERIAHSFRMNIKMLRGEDVKALRRLERDADAPDAAGAAGSKADAATVNPGQRPMVEGR